MTAFNINKPLVKILLPSLRPGDGFILLLFVVLAISSFWVGSLVGAKEKTAADFTAIVTLDNRQVAAVSLKNPAAVNVPGALGEITLRVEKNSIRVLHSSCPNQVCVKQGAVHRPGEMLICVPNRLVILIHGPKPPASDQMPIESHGDAVTY